MPDGIRSGGGWPLSEWPKAWKQPAREPMVIVRLECCRRRYAEPLPAIGSRLMCGEHGIATRVIAHESE